MTFWLIAYMLGKCAQQICAFISFFGPSKLKPFTHIIDRDFATEHGSGHDSSLTPNGEAVVNGVQHRTRGIAVRQVGLTLQLLQECHKGHQSVIKEMKY